MPQPLNLIGQTFGELTVLEKSPERKTGSVVWICQCSCGNKTAVRGSHLVSGHTRSCGCLQKKVTSQMNPAMDITGQRFGKLVAIKRAASKNKHTYWECQCDCGNICEIRTDHLKSGHTTSCGCITSKGEEQIALWLTSHGISFERQKTFKDCKNLKTNNLLRFDFFINDNFLLEYDGITHFKATGGWNNEEMVQSMKERDNIKDEWAKRNKILLYRLNYNDIYTNEKLNETLLNIINTTKGE